jgi:hypothetical protein
MFGLYGFCRTNRTSKIPIYKFEYSQVENLVIEVEIIVIGLIDEEWSEWLGGLALSRPEPDQTLLTGVLPDQAAVYGVIARMRDMGLQLSSLKIETAEKNNAGLPQ